MDMGRMVPNVVPNKGPIFMNFLGNIDCSSCEEVPSQFFAIKGVKNVADVFQTSLR